MTIQLATSTRNARLDAIETEIGTSPIMRIRTGAQPANIAAASSGTVLATINLPSDWMAPASGGSKAMAGTWQDASADAGGTAGHYEIVASDGTTRKMQGSITATGGGGDMTLDNIVLAATQQFNVTGFTLTDANA